VGGCNPPYEDCNQYYADGCETNLSKNAAHCGACGHVCDAGSCNDGVCGTPDAGTD
jgi:hypothetical protein